MQSACVLHMLEVWSQRSRNEGTMAGPKIQTFRRFLGRRFFVKSAQFYKSLWVKIGCIQTLQFPNPLLLKRVSPVSKDRLRTFAWVVQMSFSGPHATLSFQVSYLNSYLIFIYLPIKGEKIGDKFYRVGNLPGCLLCGALIRVPDPAGQLLNWNRCFPLKLRKKKNIHALRIT